VPAEAPAAAPAPAPGPQAPAGAGLARQGAGLAIDDLRDTGEKGARIALTIFAVPPWIILLALAFGTFGIGLVVIGFGVLMGYIARLFILAYIKTNAVRASPTQFPRIHQAAQDASTRLGIEKPDIYVLQESVWNAFAAKLAGRRIVVLLSGAVDSILLTGDMEQVKWLVGHEIGHHAAGHFGIWNMLICMGGWMPWFLLWYRRRAELTCDNIGLYAAGLEASLKALANATVGAQLAARVNVREAIDQWNAHRGEFFVRYRTIYSAHPPHLWRMANMVRMAERLGLAG
jgi:Zn-dependent protease with chaperone function